jgi:hypothetical protein
MVQNIAASTASHWSIPFKLRDDIQPKGTNFFKFSPESLSSFPVAMMNPNTLNHSLKLERASGLVMVSNTPKGTSQKLVYLVLELDQHDTQDEGFLLPKI